MCGIAGYFLISRYADGFEAVLRMTRAIAHRGPDDEGVTLINPDTGGACDLLTDASADGAERQQPLRADVIRHHRIAFGHRRFSIVDLSPGGHQPFWSTDRSVCVAFNGEIYNYIELRKELEALGHTFRTSSDTEVLVEAYREWGTDCFVRFVGFWAIALYDADKRSVLLSRDRVGKAPLYVARANGALWWCSELKGILAATGRSAFAVSEQAVSDFVVSGYRDLFGNTFYQGITSFPRASFAWVAENGSFEPQRFWDLPRERLKGRDISPSEAAGELLQRLSEALRIRLRADVSVGLELSGGMDSSVLLALGARMGAVVRSYTASFPGAGADEEHYARLVVDRYSENVRHAVVRQPIADFFDSADAYVGHMDEPFHSPNMLTNQRIWRAMATEGIRVSINGAAGDELLAGYPGIYHIPFISDLLRHGHMGQAHRECVRFSEAPVRMLSCAYLRRAIQVLKCLSKETFPRPAARWVGRRGRSNLSQPFLRLCVEPRQRPISRINELLIENMTEWQMNYWLRSGNQSYMGVPIEVRAPFLDHRVIEFLFTLPIDYLIHNGWLKWILRQAAKDLLPAAVVWRQQKVGFPFPITDWLMASKRRFLTAVGFLDCPYIDLASVRTHYESLVSENPMLLWRMMRVCLWWKKCVQCESLPAMSAAA